MIEFSKEGTINRETLIFEDKCVFEEFGVSESLNNQITYEMLHNCIPQQWPRSKFSAQLKQTVLIRGVTP